MSKSAEAFRTISEVAEWLGVQTHVLRFWESKFNQVRPVKRAGGRRYYRPNDMLLLGGIRQLLHVDGLTVKGVQKLLREEGVAYVVAKSKPLDELTTAEIDGTESAAETDMPSAADTAALEGVAVDETPELALDPQTPEDSPALETAPAGALQPGLALETSPPDPALEETAEPAALDATNDQLEDRPPEEPPASATPDSLENTADIAAPDYVPAPMADEVSVAPEVEIPPEPVPEEAMATELLMDTEDGDATPPPELEDFTAQPVAEEAAAPAGPTPNVIDAPDPPAIEDMPAMAGALSRLATRNALSAEEKAAVAPLLKDLAALREKMAAAG